MHLPRALRSARWCGPRAIACREHRAARRASKAKERSARPEARPGAAAGLALTGGIDQLCVEHETRRGLRGDGACATDDGGAVFGDFEDLLTRCGFLKTRVGRSGRFDGDDLDRSGGIVARALRAPGEGDGREAGQSPSEDHASHTAAHPTMVPHPAEGPRLSIPDAASGTSVRTHDADCPSNDALPVRAR